MFRLWVWFWFQLQFDVFFLQFQFQLLQIIGGSQFLASDRLWHDAWREEAWVAVASFCEDVIKQQEKEKGETENRHPADE